MTNYEAIKKSFDDKATTDPVLRSVLKRVQNSSVNFADTAKYADRVSDILGQILSEHVKNLAAGEREQVCQKLLLEQYNSMNELLATVQKQLDKKAGLHLRTQKPSFPAERVQQVTHALEDPTVKPEVIQRRANAPIANVSRSFHDDYIRENARFRNNAGLCCYLVRAVVGGCCPWCTEVAGRYVYGSHPDNIFRRHDNCGCTVTFENGRQRQNVWTKKTWNARNITSTEPTPTVLTLEQAKITEQQNLQYRGLTFVDRSGIMNDNKTGIHLDTELYHGEVVHYDITDERIEHISDIEILQFSTEKNQKLTQGCRNLLEHMKDDKLGREGALVFNMDMAEIDRYKAPGATSSISLKSYPQDCIVIHNHPSDTLLSDSDLLNFYMHDEVKILGAVGHNGSAYFIEKTGNYDALGFWDHLEECKLDFPVIMSPTDKVKYIEKIMKGADEYGIRFYTKIYQESN